MEQLDIIIEGSARHVHVTKEHLAILFGTDHELHPKRWLSQPGEHLCDEKLEVVGPKGSLKGVSIIGPVRSYTQIEVAFSDARTLGLVPPIRESGVVAGSDAVTLIGPNGTLELKEGAIVAKRHVHLTPEDAEKYGIKDKEIVQVKVSGPRALIFDEVVARVSPKYATYMHIDYEELNAAGLGTGEPHGIVIKK